MKLTTCYVKRNVTFLKNFQQIEKSVGKAVEIKENFDELMEKNFGGSVMKFWRKLGEILIIF